MKILEKNLQTHTLPKEAKLQLEAKKVLNGKAIEDGQFEFELKENGTILHTVSNDAKVDSI